MNDNNKSGDTLAELRERIRKARGRLDRIGKGRPKDTVKNVPGGSAPAVEPAATPTGARCATALEHVRSGAGFANMTIATTTAPRRRPFRGVSQKTEESRAEYARLFSNMHFEAGQPPK